ncbi:MFS transporter [Novosphingobium taihuense]|uniref:Na+/melibiose symporter-like transporter n=1 Tax=Novosphingobium taihuense TaxID=260085 RepID=A0A7W7AEE7_9SPHN|nr:MFS transporter [Novosphingobium taihuense]MBB4614819.1 Na+/melibiose symporter-like transporter [Novosphingobium taihuense]TWH84739.1 Na+/melibiose symporter-like transporter [Novosphingobium taihuense]
MLLANQSDGASGLGRATKAGFALGQVAGQLFRDAPSLLLLFYLTNVMGIAPAIAGAAIFVPKVVFGVIFDLWIGVASDRMAARFPRRQWLLVGGIAAPFAMLGPFAVPEAAMMVQVAWVFVTFSAYMAVYSTFSVPYLAQFAEMSSDPVERTELMGWKHGFTGLGVLLSSSFAPMLVNRLGMDRQGHLITMVVLGLIAMTCLLVAWRFAARIREPGGAAKAFAIRDLPRAFADRRFAVLCLSAVVMTVGAGISYAGFPFFVKYAMARPEPLHDIGVMSAIMAVAVMAGSPLWVMVAKRIGKKQTYVIAASGHGLVTLLWGQMAHVPMPVAWALAAIMAACNAGWGTIVLSLLSDCIAHARDEHGENRAGTYSAIWSVIEKAGIALGGTLVVGAILSAWGFDAAAARAGVAQSAEAIAGTVMAYSVVPGVTKLIAALIIWRFVHEKPQTEEGTLAHA